MVDSVTEFESERYRKHDAARLEHFKSLGIDLKGKTLLEVGAGIGQHTKTLQDLGAIVTTSDVREENLKLLRENYVGLRVLKVNLDDPPILEEKFQIVYCYGTLYHLSKPEEAIRFMSGCCLETLVVETCVQFEQGEDITYKKEDKGARSQSFVGLGCVPTRLWVYKQLKKHFQWVYLPITQPKHPEFPKDWRSVQGMNKELNRAIFVATRIKRETILMVEEIPEVYK